MASNISCSDNSTNSFLTNATSNSCTAKDDSESVVTGISSLDITNSLSSCSQSEEEAEDQIDSYEPFKEDKIERWITCYSSSHSILLVGEGDFSFSACLARAFGSASNMVATSLDSKEMLCRRLPGSESHIEYLRELGCLVLHEVDVHDMASAYPELVNIKFDRIVFNFPHAGHFGVSGENETNPRVIKRNKTLLSGFFKSSSEMLSGIGEVHVAHRDDHPYSAWDIEKLADEAGLTLITKLYFCLSEYPEYSNKRGSYSRPSGSFPLLLKIKLITTLIY